MENEYDEMLEKAEEMSKNEIMEKLAAVGEFDVDRLRDAFKERLAAEKAAMDTLVDNLKAAADGAEKRRAWAALSINGGIEILKIAKKVLLATIVAFLIVSPVSAQQVLEISTELLTAMSTASAPAPTGIFNVNSPYVKRVIEASKRTRGGIGTNLNAVSATVGYVPVVWDKKRSYWDLGFGVSTKKFNTEDVTYGGGFSINLLAMAHDGLKNLFGDRVGFLDLPGTWLGVGVASPAPDHIDARWDYKEKIQIQLTYAFFGNGS